MDRFRDVTSVAKNHGITIRGYLSCTIACPYEGNIAPKEVARVTEMLLDLGCHEISLGDTIGVGTPASTVAMLDSVFGVVGNDTEKLAVHFHDT
jgi:hydroxymethylglutaryl-CoA lyase